MKGKQTIEKDRERERVALNSKGKDRCLLM